MYIMYGYSLWALFRSGNIDVASIMFFQGAGQNDLGIYVKSVVTGGAAELVGNFDHFRTFIEISKLDLITGEGTLPIRSGVLIGKKPKFQIDRSP